MFFSSSLGHNYWQPIIWFFSYRLMSLEKTWQRDQRPFLHTEPLQILQIHSSINGASSIQFTPLICYRLQVGELGSFILCSVTHFCVDVCFRLLSWWKILPWPIIGFLTEAVRFRFFYLLVFKRIHDAMSLNKMSRTSGRKIGPQHYTSSSIFIHGHGVIFPCLHQNHLACLLPKSSFF